MGKKQEIVLPESWSDLLYTSDVQKLVAEVKKFLVPLARQGLLSEKNFRIFQQDMLQLFFAYMEKKGMHAHELYDNQEIYRLYKIAILSIDGMCRWVERCSELITRQHQMKEGSLGNRVVREVKEYIRENLKNEITMKQISEVTHLNPDYTTRIFRKMTGMTIRDYVIRKRMERAKLLLETTDLSVSGVAMESGYDNFSYFVQVFRRYFGMTPNRFRRDMREHELRKENENLQ